MADFVKSLELFSLRALEGQLFFILFPFLFRFPLPFPFFSFLPSPSALVPQFHVAQVTWNQEQNRKMLLFEGSRFLAAHLDVCLIPI